MISTREERPEGLTDEHLEYLDELRESGRVNMFGARPYLAEAFDLDGETAGKFVTFWMRTFSERHAASHIHATSALAVSPARRASGVSWKLPTNRHGGIR